MDKNNDFVIKKGVLKKYKGGGGNVIIPDGVTKIGGHAVPFDFYHGAFHNCKTLISVVIPDGVTEIGDGVFMHCANLTSVKIPNSVTSIGWQAFGDCTRLTSVRIPDNVNYIEYCAFYRCKALTSITIPDGVQRIGETAFGGCDNLKEASLPSGITLEENVFPEHTKITYRNSGKSDDSSLKFTEPEFVIENHLLQKYNGQKAQVQIPEGVSEISDFAFAYCETLQSVIFPEHVAKIGQNAFLNCKNLKEVILMEGTEISIILGVFPAGTKITMQKKHVPVRRKVCSFSPLNKAEIKKLSS